MQILLCTLFAGYDNINIIQAYSLWIIIKFSIMLIYRNLYLVKNK
jgi:hypothetical protein